MTRSRMVTQLRQYSVIDVQGAKDVAMIWLEKANLQNAITFGLPEVDDRYHVWRVPLLNRSTQERIGEVDGQSGTQQPSLLLIELDKTAVLRSWRTK